jgi:hypothetical protein
MITGDPINDDIQWLLQELKQVDKDLEAVNVSFEGCSDSGWCGTGYGYCDTTWNRNRKYDGLDKVKYAYE